MIYASVCSGIEAPTVAWHELGWVPAWFSEIEKFPSEVLAQRWSAVPNLGDMNLVHEKPEFNTGIELLVGGTPCQSFSVAGLRKGLDDPRGNLALVFLGIVAKTRPRWVVWENVPGVLSSNGGKDFGSFLGALAELGYGFAYRTLDAQYFGVPQRRRRVFVVGYFGNWRPAGSVLFEQESLRGNLKKSRETRQETSRATGASSDSGCQTVDFRNLRFGEADLAGTIQAKKSGGYSLNYTTGILASLTGISNYKPGIPTLGASGGDAGGGSELLVETFDRQSSSEYGSATVDATVAARDYKSASDLIAFNWQENSNFVAGDVTNPLRVGQTEAVCFQSSQSGVRLVENHATLDSNNGSRRHNGVVLGSAVRRLTPTECERLQGFPDGYTNIQWGKKCPDGPRYKALGNSMAVPVMRYLGERIQIVDDICQNG